MIGISGAKMAQYRASWQESVLACADLIWRPHLLGILLLEVCSYVRASSTSTLSLTTVLRAWSLDSLVLDSMCVGVMFLSCPVPIILAFALQTTMVVFLGLPPPNGYGFNDIAIAGTYGTPIVGRSCHTVH